ncbi:MAG: MXAN_5187 C-terminal domain-containing protein [Acidobacteriota bacterium]
MANDDTLERIDRGIQTLRIEFERFFAGGTRVPPEDLRLKLALDLRNLRNSNITSAADNFRLSTLEARFNTYNELFNRRLREREEGRTAAAMAAHESAHPETPRFDASAGITLGTSAPMEAVEALFDSMYRNATNRKVDLDSFRNYLTQQVDGIRQKTGCEEVQFRITMEDGKPRLKAKPINTARQSSRPSA